MNFKVSKISLGSVSNFRICSIDNGIVFSFDSYDDTGKTDNTYFELTKIDQLEYIGHILLSKALELKLREKDSYAKIL
jgi:hypothetical protein